MNKMIQVTYDTKQDYDVEYGIFKRMYMYGSYDEAAKMFRDKFPEMKVFSYDEVLIDVKYVSP